MTRFTPLSSLPKNLVVVGVDEVAMGTWAGPMVACAVAIHAGDTKVPGVADSKTLSDTARERLREPILSACLDVGFGWVSNKEVDALGHEAAHRKVLVGAVMDLTVTPGRVYVDGRMYLPELRHLPVEFVGSGDMLLWPISAASILAKQEQKFWMRTYAHVRWPGYGFDKHAGYGTKQHQEALEKRGPCPIHRMSLKPLRRFNTEET